jgi:hypothetical protein
VRRVWPFRSRHRAEAEHHEQAPVWRAAPSGWREVQTIQPVMSEPPVINTAENFSSTLSSWRDPRSMAPLGHRLAAPAEPLAATAEPNRPIVLPAPAEPDRPAAAASTPAPPAISVPPTAPVQRIMSTPTAPIAIAVSRMVPAPGPASSPAPEVLLPLVGAAPVVPGPAVTARPMVAVPVAPQGGPMIQRAPADSATSSSTSDNILPPGSQPDAGPAVTARPTEMGHLALPVRPVGIGPPDVARPVPAAAPPDAAAPVD